MKKTLPVLLAILGIVLSLSVGTRSGSVVGQEARAATKPRVAFITQIQGIPYFNSFKIGAMAAAQRFGLAYTQTGPTTVNAAEQLRIFDSLVSQKYDLISISPLDPISINSAISTAMAKGIKVITADADAAKSKRVVYVAQATDQALGYVLMDSLAKQIGYSGKIGIVSGIPDTASLDTWVRYMQQRIKQKYPKITVVGGIRHTSDSAQALEQAQQLLTAFPDIKGLVAVPSTAVPGVAQAVSNAGKAGQVAVIGYGSPNTARPFVNRGVIKYTVFWNAKELGYLTVWAMRQVLDGKSFVAKNNVPGINHPIAYDSAKQMLILGPPVLYGKANIDQANY